MDGMTAALEVVERDKYDRVWQLPAYRIKCHSLELWHTRRELFPEFETALDIGCGLGRWFGAMNAAGRDVWAIDLSDQSLDAAEAAAWSHKRAVGNVCNMRWPMLDGAPARFDFGLCCDFMEHIPPGSVDAALRRIIETVDECLFLIADFPSHNPETREDLHPSRFPMHDWLARMAAIGGTADEIETQGAASGRLKYLIRWRR